MLLVAVAQVAQADQVGAVADLVVLATLGQLQVLHMAVVVEAVEVFHTVMLEVVAPEAVVLEQLVGVVPVQVLLA
jgi:hypothetical protein